MPLPAARERVDQMASKTSKYTHLHQHYGNLNSDNTLIVGERISQQRQQYCRMGLDSHSGLGDRCHVTPPKTTWVLLAPRGLRS
jgi:hypothetical protein